MTRPSAPSRLTALLAALLAAAAMADGVTLPRTWTAGSEIDANQFGYTSVTISTDGTVAATTRYSNGKKVDGDHFVTVGIVYSSDDVPLLGFTYGAGLNASFFGGAVEETAGWIGQIDPPLVGEVGWVGVAHRTEDKVNDQELWEQIGKIAAEVFKAYVSSQGESAAMVGNMPVAFIGLDGDGARLGDSPLGISLPAAIPSR